MKKKICRAFFFLILTATASQSQDTLFLRKTNGDLFLFPTNEIDSITFGGSSKTNSLKIGDNYGGGKVAYILQPNDSGYVAGETHGLVAALIDQSAVAKWGCNGTTIAGAFGYKVGTGRRNTTSIVIACREARIAARLCDDLVLNGYSDWHLPSLDEMQAVYDNRALIGGFDDQNFYWTSTDYLEGTAWVFVFVNGGGAYSGPNYDKYAPFNVRAVRYF